MERVTIETMAKEAMDSKGYVGFVGFLTSERDKDGNPIIQFRYDRNHYALEDLKSALEAFKNLIEEDIMEMAKRLTSGIPEELNPNAESGNS